MRLNIKMHYSQYLIKVRNFNLYILCNFMKNWMKKINLEKKCKKVGMKGTIYRE